MALGGDRDALLQELSRINSSSLFRSSDRLRRLLHFLVIETADGRGASLKEYTVGLSVFDKPESFDPKVDSTVRSEVSKLRSKLRLYYETEGSANAVVVSIPKGGYSAEWQVRQPDVTPGDLTDPPASVSGMRPWVASVSRFRRWIATGFLSIGMLSLPFWINRDKPSTQFRSIPVTSGPRAAKYPSFSPDGSQIAFSSDMADPGNLDIFIKGVDSGSVLRLTSDPAPDSHPAWSPDGKSIAFVRNAGYGGAVYLVPVTGGPERKLRNVNLAGLTWFPDGNHLAALNRDLAPPAFLLIDSEGRQSKPLTRPPAGWMDWNIAFSPDGARAAVGRCTPHLGCCDIYLADVRPDRTLAEPFRRVTWLNQSIQGIAWAGDNSTIVFSAGHYIDYKLFRLDTRRIEAGPQRVNGIVSSGQYPSIPLRGPASLKRIALVASTRDENMWVASLANISGQQPVVPARQLAPSPRGERHPMLSADGTRLVFASDRSGSNQVWAGPADGTDPHPITPVDSGMVSFPQFSPVSDDIAFVLSDTKNGYDERGIYTIRSDRTGLRRITGPNHRPTDHSWSADGKWIYFSSQATGPWQVWKVAAAGGTPKQVTRFGGYRALESNGALYFFSAGAVWSTGVNGGPERKVLSLERGVPWFPVRDGLLFIPPAQPDSGTTALSHWNAATGTIQPVARLPHPAIRRFSFFEKTSTVLYDRMDYESHDIIVLENYDSVN